MFGPELIEAFREFKSIGTGLEDEPRQGRRPVPARLEHPPRAGDFNPPPVDSHFSFLKDRGSFAHATARCVGVGKCRHTTAA